MAYKKAAEETKREYYDVKGMKISNARILSDNVLAFTLSGKGVGFYNLRVVNSSKGKFIGVPQTKGKDGKWYNQYSLYLSEDDQKKIIEAVEKELDL